MTEYCVSVKYSVFSPIFYASAIFLIILILKNINLYNLLIRNQYRLIT